MGATFNNASTPDQGMPFLGTKGSLTLLLGGAMTTLAEFKAEGYGYSIDSWPKNLQEEFMNMGNHRAESQGQGPPPKPEDVPFDNQADATVLHLAEFFNAFAAARRATRQPRSATTPPPPATW